MEDKTPDLTAELVHLTRFDADIAQLRKECSEVNARIDYEETRIKIRRLVTLRTTIEKTRTTLNADALKYQRKVNEVAKKLTADIKGIEDPLQKSKNEVDAEKEAAKRAEAEAAQRAIEEAARLKAMAEQREREEAMARQQAQLREEAERLRKEREAYEAEMKAYREEQARKLREEEIKQRAEREKIALENKRLEEVRLKLERQAEEAERRRKADEDAQLLKEAQAREAEQQRLAKEQYDREQAEMAKRVEEDKLREAERQVALEPDRKKFADYAKKIRDLKAKAPKVKTTEATNFLEANLFNLLGIADELETWEGA